MSRLDNPSLEEIVGSFSDIPEVDSSLKLKFVMFFGRHGARTPIKTLPNVESVLWDKSTMFADAEDTEIDYVICGLDGGRRPEPVMENRYRKIILRGGSYGGQLTGKGMKQAYQLGQSFRNLYVDKLHFLSADFSSEIYIRSTNINRCIETARCMVAGMYGDEMKSNQKEPLKVHVDHDHTEVLYPQEELHPSVKDMWRQAKHDHDYIPGMAELRQKARHLLGLSEGDKVDLTHVKDDLSTRLVHGFELPPQFDDDFITELSALTPKVLQYAMGGPPGEKDKYLPIAAGPLLHLIQQVLHQLKENKLKEKAQLYFCHDTTLTALLVALSIFDNEWPPLCCSVTLEMYQHKDGRYFLRVLYRGQVQKIFESSEEILLVDDVIAKLRPLSLSWDEFILSSKSA